MTNDPARTPDGLELPAGRHNARTLRRALERQKGQCTWCGSQVPPGRRTWCGHDCWAAYRAIYDWQCIVRAVYERDEGRCVLCGCDFGWLERILNRLACGDYAARMHWAAYMIRLGWDDVWKQQLWETDHIIAWVEGGSDRQENLRTLCVPCHKRVTAELAARRAAERRDAGRPLLRTD